MWMLDHTTKIFLGRTVSLCITLRHDIFCDVQVRSRMVFHISEGTLTPTKRQGVVAGVATTPQVMLQIQTRSNVARSGTVEWGVVGDGEATTRRETVAAV